MYQTKTSNGHTPDSYDHSGWLKNDSCEWLASLAALALTLVVAVALPASSLPSVDCCSLLYRVWHLQHQAICGNGLDTTVTWTSWEYGRLAHGSFNNAEQCTGGTTDQHRRKNEARLGESKTVSLLSVVGFGTSPGSMFDTIYLHW